MTLTRWPTFLLEFLTVTLTVLFCWVSFFLLTLVFVLHLHGLYLFCLSSPWFAAACAAAIVHRNLFFFRFYQQNKSSASHLQLTVVKEFLKLPNQFILIKVKIYYFPETWLSQLLVNC